MTNRLRLILCLIMLVVGVHQPVAASPAKRLFAVFYWWYPYYGAQWVRADGTLMPTERSGDNVRLDRVGFYPLTHAIPYLYSDEHPTGRHDDAAAIDWYAGNLARAADAGIDVLLLPARPDLPLWDTALDQLAAAQDALTASGHHPPQLAFMLDGIEYWQHSSARDSLLTGGDRYPIVRDGLVSIVTSARTLGSRAYRFEGQLPIFVYRVEGGQGAFEADAWWTRQVHADVLHATGEDVYLVLDELWCGYRYGGRVMRSCEADNWFLWGATVTGRIFSRYGQYPRIANITVGFSGVKPSGYVSNTQTLPRSLTAYTARWVAAWSADWIILETWNFVEENSQIDVTPLWGDSYLRQTALLKAGWQ